MARLRFRSSSRVAGADAGVVVVVLVVLLAAALADAGGVGEEEELVGVPPVLPGALLVIGLEIADT